MTSPAAIVGDDEADSASGHTEGGPSSVAVVLGPEGTTSEAAQTSEPVNTTSPQATASPDVTSINTVVETVLDGIIEAAVTSSSSTETATGEIAATESAVQREAAAENQSTVTSGDAVTEVGVTLLDGIIEAAVGEAAGGLIIEAAAVSDVREASVKTATVGEIAEVSSAISPGSEEEAAKRPEGLRIEAVSTGFSPAGTASPETCLTTTETCLTASSEEATASTSPVKTREVATTQPDSSSSSSSSSRTPPVLLCSPETSAEKKVRFDVPGNMPDLSGDTNDRSPPGTPRSDDSGSERESLKQTPPRIRRLRKRDPADHFPIGIGPKMKWSEFWRFRGIWSVLIRIQNVP